MTAIHLSAKNGHINVLDALKGSVSFKITSTKVSLFFYYYYFHNNFCTIVVTVYMLYKNMYNVPFQLLKAKE